MPSVSETRLHVGIGPPPSLPALETRGLKNGRVGILGLSKIYALAWIRGSRTANEGFVRKNPFVRMDSVEGANSGLIRRRDRIAKKSGILLDFLRPLG